MVCRARSLGIAADGGKIRTDKLRTAGLGTRIPKLTTANHDCHRERSWPSEHLGAAPTDALCGGFNIENNLPKIWFPLKMCREISTPFMMQNPGMTTLPNYNIFLNIKFPLNASICTCIQMCKDVITQIGKWTQHIFTTSKSQRTVNVGSKTPCQYPPRFLRMRFVNACKNCNWFFQRSRDNQNIHHSVKWQKFLLTLTSFSFIGTTCNIAE